MLYLSNPAEDKFLYQNLIQAGIRVCKIGTISRLHTILESQSFDCILVNRSFFKLHELSPARHLWNARSPQTIICWTKNHDGSISGETHSIPTENCSTTQTSDYYEKIERIKEILSGIQQIQHTELDDKPCQAQQKPVVQISEEMHLHKKIRLILENLLCSGETGMDCSAIIDRIWGKSEKNRTKDVQIYISKLRGILSRTSNMHYQILYKNKRYYLLNSESHKR